jgi:phosphate starvation-inducible protein PhoH and related proteins
MSSKSKRRRNRKLSEDELREVEEFVYSKNYEEEKFLSSMFVNVKPKTESQKNLISAIKKNEITIASGLAGSGKTIIAIAEALRLIKTGRYKKIILVKSVTQLKNEELGFLKGDLHEKLDPYMMSFIDNFEKLIGESMTKKLKDLGIIQVQPLAFIRGRSIDNAIIIIDEAQNITLDNMRTIMTRIGENSKMIILGDVKQKDIKNKRDSSLEVIIDKFDNIEGFGCVTLRNPEDVVRNPIIKIIEDVFDNMSEG